MVARVVTLAAIACLLPSCSKDGPSGTSAPVVAPTDGSSSHASAWLEESLAELPGLDTSDQPWDARTCPADLEVEPCAEPAAAPAAALFELEDAVAVNWCDPERRVVVRCFGDTTEGPFELRSVLHYDPDGVGFRRIDEAHGDAGPPREVTILRVLPDEVRREVVLEWSERSATQPSRASMTEERAGDLLRSQGFTDGVLTRDERCVYEGQARRCTRRSFEDTGDLYRTLEFQEEPRLCLRASRTTWSSGRVEQVYVERGEGPLAPLLAWSRTVWGGPAREDEDDVAVVSWTNDSTDPAFELTLTRSSVPCQESGQSYSVGQGELVEQQLCAQACDSIGSNCSESQCRAMSPEELEGIHADARRQLEQRLGPPTGR